VNARCAIEDIPRTRLARSARRTRCTRQLARAQRPLTLHVEIERRNASSFARALRGRATMCA